MYNFLDPKLMPKVSCDSPSTDNYEPTNLISEKEAIRARGFLAYTVTKPPVELQFEFLCPIDISYITLITTVGTQKCTGIEIFVKTQNSTFDSIAKAFYNTSGLTFCNSRRYSKTNPPPHHDSSNDLFFFRSDKFRIFSEALVLKVVIFRTERTVPCLGSIKVFGNPARSCSKTTVETIARIMGGIRPTLVRNENSCDNNNLKIPEDFTDDLTCEIMAIPMTLPSGHTVDRDTLEKHVENEKSFGRKPCDPFTGLKFTETRKPVMNTALKSRIDMFLLQNSNNPVTYGLKRALGNSCFSNDHKKMKLSNENLASTECCLCGGNEVLYVIPCKHFYCRLCLLNLKRYNCNKCGREFARNEPERYYY